ncbi:hypothetical protein E2C01_093528 [Portunus trituberculatus]|uniref:Uncharacterized protein n=1 Tax=Portunus trituberculatus TaxID=210409 RepID=A0A5B7K0P1_PORTR|nr:hypothetical protein [Portunus trituberculatus]
MYRLYQPPRPYLDNRRCCGMHKRGVSGLPSPSPPPTPTSSSSSSSSPFVCVQPAPHYAPFSSFKRGFSSSSVP